MSQPAVSQYIQALERTIGARLFERSNKFVRLTKAGEITYHHAKEILGLYTRMQCLVDDLMHKASGELSIGASYTYGEYVLPRIIASMQQRYPLINPTITIGNSREIAEAVIHNQLDVGVIEGDFAHEKLTIDPFATDRMYVIAAPHHPLARKDEPITAADLEQATWIVRERGSGTRETTEKLFARLEFTPAKIMEFGSTQIIKESVEAGLGITLLSEWVVRKERTLGSLTMLEIEGLPMIRQFSLVTQAMPFQTKAMELFIAVLREEMELT